MEFRSKYGEKISGDSWLMRDMWQTSNIKSGSQNDVNLDSQTTSPIEYSVQIPMMKASSEVIKT
jgi:hypothetical protein